MSFVPPPPGNLIPGSPGASSLASLPVGKIVQSRVLQSLGNDLFRLGVAGGEVVASSRIALAPGSRVDIEILNSGPQPTVRVLGPANPTSLVKSNAIENENLATTQALAGRIPPTSTGSGVVVPKGAFLDELVQLRPDLAGRVDSLLRIFDAPGGGFGEKLSSLLDSFPLPGVQKGVGAPSTPSELLESLRSRLLSPDDLQSGGELAKLLGKEWPAWTGRLEASLARLLTLGRSASGSPAGSTPATAPSVVIAGPTAIPSGTQTPPTPVPSGATADGSGSSSLPQNIVGRESANHQGVDPSSLGDPRRVLTNDLKGHLLGVKTQLQGLESTPAVGVPLGRAIEQIDGLVDHLTGQQLRNVDRQGPFIHVEIPVDPRSGLTEARLRVFRRSEAEGGNSRDETRFTVGLFLRMTKLGTVTATVAGVNGATSVSFTVENEPAQSALTKGLSELRESLIAMGMDAAAIQVRVREPKADTEVDSLWMEFLDREPDGAFRPNLDTRA